MNDTHTLLGQLKIDRGDDEEPPRRGWRWLLAALLVLLAAAAIIWMMRDTRVPVSVAVVSVAPGGPQAASLLDASGYVVARRRATVSAKVTGKLQELYIEEGQRVEAGEVIARLDDSNAQAALQEARARVAQAEASLAAARAAAANIRPIHERVVAQAEANIVSREALDNSKASFDAQQYALRVAEQTLAVARAGLLGAQRAADDTTVRAPFAGVITQKAAQPGEIVSPISAGGGFTRTGIGTLVDMDSLEIEVDVNENFINRVRSGQPASARLNAYPDWQIPAEVIAVIPTADRSKATVKVRVGFKQKDSKILPDMGVRVSFLSEPATATGSATPALGLPSAAVQAEAGADSGIVYVIEGERVARRSVRIGTRDGEQLTLLSGVAAGERVAIGDLARLADGVPVRIQQP